MSYDPLFPPSEDATHKSAVELIRAKVARAYAHEPSAVEELAEVKQQRVLSKHQLFMQELGASGKSLAEVQTAWHHYYVKLSDADKHQVWQEFYDANSHTPYQKLFQQGQPSQAQAPQPMQPAPAMQMPQTPVVVDHTPPAPRYLSKQDKPASRLLKSKIVTKISANGKLSTKHHLQSLGFGLASGFVVLILFLFTFFNEYIIAPFIQPSRNVSSTPIILGSSTVAADAPPSVMIPKINIQIPIDFSVDSFDENVVDEGLKTGVIHYPNTVLPGQNGNGAFFGHSSGNIFNNGKYKFAFTLLHDLTTGDLFYINYSGKTYAYQVFEREIVPPSQVSVISDTKGKQATVTLITCDPPGISTNRLVIWGEQISPSPSTNTTAAPASDTMGNPVQLTGNGPTLWSNFVNWVEFWK